MPNEESGLMDEFERLTYQYHIIQFESYIFKTLDQLRNTGAGVRAVLELLTRIMYDFKESEHKSSFKGEAIMFIYKHMLEVGNLEELDNKLAFLAQDIAMRREKNELSIDTLVHKMSDSDNPNFQRIASAYLDSDGNLALAVLEFTKVRIEELISEHSGEFPGTSGRTGRGHI